MKAKFLSVIVFILIAAAILIIVFRADKIDSKWTADFVVMLATIAIAYFARSTDKAYHRIADVAEKLAMVSRQQFEIMVAHDEPIIRAKIRTFDDPNLANAKVQALVIDNDGPPITEISVERAEVYEITYWMPNSPFKREEKRFGTIGYFPGSTLINSGTKTIYETYPSRYFSLVAEIHSTTDREFNGYNTMLNFRRFFRIDYRNQIGGRRTRWFAVDEFGSREIDEKEGIAQSELIKKSVLANEAFVFYQMGMDQLWDIVSRIAPVSEAPPDLRGYFFSVFSRLHSRAKRFFNP
jgi:hypothetical protein